MVGDGFASEDNIEKYNEFVIILHAALCHTIGEGPSVGVQREDVQGIKGQHAEEPYGFTGHKMLL
jgi:hypothetical protein